MIERKSLLLHICCAPDEAWVVKTLKDEYDLFCFFCNPNITPDDEYYKRLEEAKSTAEHFGVPFAADPYDPVSWENAVRDHTHTSEGGARCQSCFDLRLEQTAKFCREHGFNTFTSVMSISPHKNITMLNKAGETAAARNGLTFVPMNFKKNNGFLNSIKLSEELGLYRQDYCGCRLSRSERDERAAKKRSL